MCPFDVLIVLCKIPDSSMCPFNCVYCAFLLLVKCNDFILLDNVMLRNKDKLVSCFYFKELNVPFSMSTSDFASLLETYHFLDKSDLVKVFLT